MTNNIVPDGHYRIRTAGAKSRIAISISKGKKCHYVQIGSKLFGFESLEDAIEFVKGKGLIADRMSLDFGTKPSEPVADDEAIADDGDEAVADGGDNSATA